MNTARILVMLSLILCAIINIAVIAFAYRRINTAPSTEDQESRNPTFSDDSESELPNRHKKKEWG